LNQIQTRHAGHDFGPCSSRIKTFKKNKSDTTECVFGLLKISKIIINKSHSEGLMYYDWHCGDLCGHSGLILSVKDEINGKCDSSGVYGDGSGLTRNDMASC
jgi:hypothetical protein